MCVLCAKRNASENEREMRALAFRGRRGFWRDHVFTTGVQERLKYPIESLPVAVFVSDLFGPYVGSHLKP